MALRSVSLSSPQFESGAKLSISVSFRHGGRLYKLALAKHIYHWGCLPINLKKGRGFKVSSFKGNSQNDHEGTDPRFSSSKKPVHLSPSQQERVKIAAESPDLIKDSLPVTSEDSETSIPGHLAIKYLFKKWLILLQNKTVSSASDEVHAKGSGQSKTMDIHPEVYGDQTRKLLKVALLHFWAIDRTIKLPLLIFPPFYLAVRLVYGVKVAKELLPLWILGPLIVAFYVLLVRAVCSLYIFCFKLCTKFIVNLPIYFGMMERLLQSHLFPSLVDLKNMEYREFAVKKLKEMRERAMERWMDFVESIWPYYCRTLRFLKRARLI